MTVSDRHGTGAQDSPRYAITTVSRGPQQSWLAAAGELDLAAAGQLEAVLRQQRESGVRFVRLDLSAVTFLDCACLGVLVGAHHRFLDSRSTLVLTGVRARVARLLMLAGLDQALFTIATPDPPTAEPDASLDAGPDQDPATGASHRSRIDAHTLGIIDAPAELDRALGIIMARRDCTATEAADVLTTLTHSTNRTASEVAHSILNVAARRRWRPVTNPGDLSTLPAAALASPAHSRTGAGISPQPGTDEHAGRACP